MVGRERQGWAIFAVMGILRSWLEHSPLMQPRAAAIRLSPIFPVDATPGALQRGGNMEGKEARFGPIQRRPSSAPPRPAPAPGPVELLHDSWTAIGGLIPLVLIKLGEITPGGVGSGLYGMVVFAIVAVFIAGLMVGEHRSTWARRSRRATSSTAAIAILVLPASILGVSAIARR